MSEVAHSAVVPGSNTAFILPDQKAGRTTAGSDLKAGSKEPVVSISGSGSVVLSDIVIPCHARA
jgi:hypothetical protein